MAHRQIHCSLLSIIVGCVPRLMFWANFSLVDFRRMYISPSLFLSFSISMSVYNGVYTVAATSGFCLEMKIPESFDGPRRKSYSTPAFSAKASKDEWTFYSGKGGEKGKTFDQPSTPDSIVREIKISLRLRSSEVNLAAAAAAACCYFEKS